MAYINYYSFHILDPEWGHIVIKMAGHPPFGAQIILNGHEYVACQASKADIAFTKEGNCFTQFTRPTDLALVADTLSDPGTTGRLSQVADRWIYSACLCFALDIAEQQRTTFQYQYSVYQLEYSRNLLFQAGSQMEEVFQQLVDRTRSRLHVPELRTCSERVPVDGLPANSRLRLWPSRSRSLGTIARCSKCNSAADTEGIHQGRTGPSL